jgi:hypothetical protein
VAVATGAKEAGPKLVFMSKLMMRLTLNVQLTELTAGHLKLQANEISKLNHLA